VNPLSVYPPALSLPDTSSTEYSSPSPKTPLATGLSNNTTPEEDAVWAALADFSGKPLNYPIPLLMIWAENFPTTISNNSHPSCKHYLYTYFLTAF
jgi:hypothetical protein